MWLVEERGGRCLLDGVGSGRAYDVSNLKDSATLMNHLACVLALLYDVNA